MEKPFKLKSGNKTSFKEMGSSPAKHGKFEDFQYGRKGHNPDTMSAKHEDFHAKQSGESPAKQTKFPIPRAKRLVRKNVGNTTIDSPNYDDSKFDKSEKQIIKAIDILRGEGYSKGEIEQMTGAGGYKAAMDWATSKEKSPAKQMVPTHPHAGEGGVTAGDIETDWEEAYRGLGVRGSIADVLKRRRIRSEKIGLDKHGKKVKKKKSPAKQKPENFNWKGGPTTTPGYESTKAAKKAAKKKMLKKGGKKILKKVGSKFLGPVGIGLGVVDAISIAGHSYDEGSLKKGVKKWWDSPGVLPTKPKFKRKKKK